MKDIITLINKWMPNLIHKNEQIYETLIGKEIFTPLVDIINSEDFKCGSIVNELEYLRGYINYIADTADIDVATGELLEEMIFLFTHLARIWDETDNDFRNRFHSLIRRNANPRWMTKWSMKDVFSYFFDADDIFIIENYIETNLLLNPGFELGSGSTFTNWSDTGGGSSAISEAVSGDQFAEARSIEFNVVSGAELYITQTISSIAQGDYKIEFFHWDDGNSTDPPIRVMIQRSSDSYYWDFAGNWQSGVIWAEVPAITGTLWEYWSAYIYQESVGAEDITITIQRNDTSDTYDFRIDQAGFGEWKTYPSFKVFIVTESALIGEYMVLWGGSIDNLFDRGECESTTSPMIFDETVPYEPVPASQTWARVSADPYMGTYNWQLNKDTAAAAGNAETFLTDSKASSDMHGLVADTEYTLAFQAKPDEITNVHKIVIYEYYSSTWNETAITLDSTSWKRYSQTITINAVTTGVAISVFIDTDAALDSTIDIDNIRLFEGEDADIEEASFFENDFLLGAGGGYSSNYYENLLDAVKPAGVKAIVDII